MEKEVLFLVSLLLFLGGGMFVSLSLGLQRGLYMIFVASTMALIADVQLMSDALGDRPGTVWGFRYTITDLLGLMLLTSLFLRSLSKTGTFRWFPSGSAAIWLLVLAAVLSVAQAQVPLASLFELNNMLLGFLIFVAVSNFIRSDRELRLALFCFVGVVAIQSLVGFKQHFQYLLGERYISRVTGMTPHPNLLALYLGSLLPLCLVLGLSARRWKARGALLAVTSLGTAAMMFTLSRGGIMALALGIGTALLLWIAFSDTRYKLTKVVMLFFLLSPLIVKWAPLVEERLSSQDANASSYGRERMTERAWDVWRERPLTGIGVNNYAVRAHAPNVHNTYLLFLTEMGVLGAAAIGILFLTFLLLAFANAVQAPRGSLLSIANMGLVGGLVAIYFQLYFEFAIRSEAIHYLFHLIAGFVAGSRWLVLAGRRGLVQEPVAVPVAPRLGPPVTSHV